MPIVARTRFVKIACTCPRGDKKKTAEDWGNLGGQWSSNLGGWEDKSLPPQHLDTRAIRINLAMWIASLALTSIPKWRPGRSTEPPSTHPRERGCQWPTARAGEDGENKVVTMTGARHRAAPEAPTGGNGHDAADTPFYCAAGT
jgi:hypothetical protein